MAYHIQLRHDTAANWTSVNPVLFSGEAGVETDTSKMKLGDGSTAWTSLAYYNGNAGDVSGPASATNNGIARYDTTTGKLIQDSGVKIDDDDHMEFADTDIFGVRSVGFIDEYDNGNSGAAKTITWGNSQKQKVELNAATVTLTHTFNSGRIGNYILMIVQADYIQCDDLTLAVTGGSDYQPDGGITVAAAANSITILTIYYDGTDAYFASIPDVKTGQTVQI